MPVTLSKFSTRLLYLTYKRLNPQYETYKPWSDAMEASLKGLFGAVSDHAYISTYIIAVPSTCGFIEISDAISQEFSKHPILKGMRYRIQLRDKMAVV